MVGRPWVVLGLAALVAGACARRPEFVVVLRGDTPLARALAEDELGARGNSAARRSAGPAAASASVLESGGGEYRGPGDGARTGPPGPVTGGGANVPVPQTDEDRPGVALAGSGGGAAPAPPRVARVELGGGASLVLERVRITVSVEGLRARTVVDHIFRNPYPERLEGTFTYTLPPDAGVSDFLMFLGGGPEDSTRFFEGTDVGDLPPADLAAIARTAPAEALGDRTGSWGRLRRAHVVDRVHALRAYETIVRENVDPALLERSPGNRFQGRVFPIEPHRRHRIVIAYEQTLRVGEAGVEYTLPLPAFAGQRVHVTLTAPRAGWTGERLVAAGRVQRAVTGDAIVYRVEPDQAAQTLRWTLQPRRSDCLVTDGPWGEGRVFVASLGLPRQPRTQTRERRDALFVLDTSAALDATRLRGYVDLLIRILRTDPSLERFNVACFASEAAWLEPTGWIANDTRGRTWARSRLERLLVEGAADPAAVAALLERTPWFAAQRPCVAFLLSDGNTTWSDEDPLATSRRLRRAGGRELTWFAYPPRNADWNRELCEALAASGGDVFPVGDDEDLFVLADQHERSGWSVERIEVRTADGRRVDDVVWRLTAENGSGRRLLVGARLSGPGPVRVRVVGRCAGTARETSFAFEVGSQGCLGARMYAEEIVTRLLARHQPEADRIARTWAQRFRIATRLTSFLIVERDADYDRLVPREDAVIDPGQAVELLETEPAPAGAPRERFLRFLQRSYARDLDERSKVLDWYRWTRESDYTVPADWLLTPPPAASLAPVAYRLALATGRPDPAVVLAEAERRLRMGRPRLAVRALSGLVEFGPQRAEMLRLVGERLIALGRWRRAAALFDRLWRLRPFEAQSAWNLLRAQWAAGRYALAALFAELVLEIPWGNPLPDSLRGIVREDFGALLAQAIADPRTEQGLRAFCRRRLAELDRAPPYGLRITLNWNTNDTDVDLWVVEANGDACGFQRKQTSSGGRLLEDVTTGLGPERYEHRDPPPGEYVVLVQYYARDRKRLAGATYAQIVVGYRGSPTEPSIERRFTVALTENGEAIEVCRLRIPGS